MNRELRRRHRRMVRLLGGAAVVVLLLAEVAHRTLLPAVLPIETRAARGALWKVTATTSVEGGWSVRTLADSSGRIAGLEVESPSPLRVPDPLLYWVPTSAFDSLLPPGATLLGPIRPGELLRAPLPGDADPGVGHLAVYSPAYRTVLLTARLPFPGGERQ